MNWLLCHTDDFTEEAYHAAYATLSASRKAHIDAFRHPGARRQSLAGELLLRKLLAQLGIDAIPERLPSGQPVIPGEPIFVSLAHCNDYVVCVADTAPVGIDIEQLRPVKDGMIHRVCTPEELLYVGQDPERFFEVWTAKEAYFKMLGTGITDLKSVNTLTLPRQLLRHGDYLIHIVYDKKR